MVNPGFSALDYAVFILYGLLIIGVGLWVSRKKKGQEKTSTDYFLASKSLALVGDWGFPDCLQHFRRAVYRNVRIGICHRTEYSHLRVDGCHHPHNRRKIFPACFPGKEDLYHAAIPGSTLRHPGADRHGHFLAACLCFCEPHFSSYTWEPWHFKPSWESRCFTD